jgi:hypothetical protein
LIFVDNATRSRTRSRPSRRAHSVRQGRQALLRYKPGKFALAEKGLVIGRMGA